MERWFLRCAKKTACGHKWAIEVADSREAYEVARAMLCPKCGHKANYYHYVMGKVHFETRPWALEKRARLVQERVAAACDARCTGAKGHHCECECGGKNHGTGAVVRWQIDNGPVPHEVLHG